MRRFEHIRTFTRTSLAAVMLLLGLLAGSHALAGFEDGGDFDQGTYSVNLIQELANIVLTNTARIGHPNSAYQLGKKLVGEENEARFKEGVRYLNIAADQGHAGARLLLGVIYIDGIGIEKGISRDVQRGVELLELAALDGNLSALHNLALMHLLGDQIAINQELGIDYLHIATFRGHSPSQLGLAKLYALGQGVPQSDVVSLALLELAKMGDDFDIKDMSETIIEDKFGTASAEQKSQAKLIASQCYESNYAICQFVISQQIHTETSEAAK